jgi:tetratricopeptide (TPR) repeat protein
MRRFPALVLAALLPALPAQAQTCEDRGSDYAARIVLCDQSFAAAPNSQAAALALAMKGEAQRLLGQLDAAAESLGLALDYAPGYAWAWVELGNVRYDQGDMAGALAHYSAALAVEDYIDAWANRAEVWWQYREGQRCSDDADNALRIDPRYAYANEVKGRCLIDLNRAEEALGYFDTALALAPGYQNAYRNKIAALANLGRHQDAVAVADEALTPGVVAASSPAIEEDILARRLLSLAEYADAGVLATEAQALIARYPANPVALNIQARALLADGKLAEADALTQPVRNRQDGRQLDGMAYDTLAQIDVALGRLDQAFANYQAALTADPSLSRAYARSLSELQFLPLSNSPNGVLTALRRCLDVKKTACLVTG